MLYQRYRLPLYSYIHKLMPTESSQVDDIFQQVWVKAVSNWSRYTDQQKLLAWLCRIAHNLVMDYYRSRSRAPISLRRISFARSGSTAVPYRAIRLSIQSA